MSTSPMVGPWGPCVLQLALDVILLRRFSHDVTVCSMFLRYQYLLIWFHNDVFIIIVLKWGLSIEICIEYNITLFELIIISFFIDWRSISNRFTNKDVIWTRFPWIYYTFHLSIVVVFCHVGDISCNIALL